MGMIYSFSGRGFDGSPALAHVIQLGAHDGNRAPAYLTPVPKRAKGRLNIQAPSWFSPDGIRCSDGSPLVGQVFFSTDDRAIDTRTDRAALDVLVAYYAGRLYQTRRPIPLAFFGYADARGAASYNKSLAQRRADAVKAFVDREIKRLAGAQASFLYRSESISFGEENALGEPEFDRRVDILELDRSCIPTVVHGDPILVAAPQKSGQTITNRLQFRTVVSWSVGLGPVGMDYLIIEIRNPRSEVSAFYQYEGPNLGANLKLPFSISPGSGYDEMVLPNGLVDIDDFSGAGSVSQAAIFGGGTACYFNGPKLQRAKYLLNADPKGLMWVSTGWSLQAGASAGGGAWVRLPCRDEACVNRHVRELQGRGRRDLQDPRGP
ncbi:MAG: hypothetical protein RKR03_20565 [Candidatus Competibacter sp.]|nr:hypothetical protein [Candidatus Competibacter sp.]MDS4058951.1 hypothetical protein [Candidatus Contendobacter sp.]